ncbi:hypothetical protein [Kaistella sp.]|uniref:hypothetical protein n=1 Tax=Kaistella sp. TaxID=2782235 RepID=UPI003C4A5E5D
MSNYKKASWGNSYNQGFQKQNNGYPNGGNFQGNGGYKGRPQTDVKKSGAVYTRMKKGKFEGQMCVNAWRKTKNGLQTASAFPVDGVEHIGAESKKTFVRMAVEVANKELGISQTYWCLMQKESQKIFIKELGLVISPNGNGVTSSGKRVKGFFGKVF